MPDPQDGQRPAGIPISLAVLLGAAAAIFCGGLIQVFVMAPYVQQAISTGKELSEISTSLMFMGPLASLATTLLGASLARLLAGAKIAAAWITAAALLVWSAGWTLFEFARPVFDHDASMAEFMVPFLIQLFVAATVALVSAAIASVLPMGNTARET